MPPKVVVIVDDDPVLLNVTVDIFESSNMLVIAFTSADEALSYLYEHAKDVSAIFTDIQMPGQMDGLILAEIVQRHWPEIIVLLTSGRVVPMGALPNNVQFVTKPWSSSEVLKWLRTTLSTA